MAALSSTDLKARLSELKKELIKLNVQVATGASLKNPGQLKQTKKAIARILTMLNEKERGKEDKKRNE